MTDDTRWNSGHADLALLAERLRPEDALAIIHQLVNHVSEDKVSLVLVELIREYIARHDDDRERQRR